LTTHTHYKTTRSSRGQSYDWGVRLAFTNRWSQASAAKEKKSKQ